MEKQQPTIDNSIFGYLDYRRFLGDLLARESAAGRLSLREFSRRAGFQTHTYIKRVISGERSLTPSSVWKVARGFGLSEAETRYLDLMVRYNQAREIGEKNDAYKNLIRLHPERHLARVWEEQYAVFAEWHNLAIREMTLLSDFVPDAEWIARSLHPTITPREATQALELLQRLGLLRRDEHGRLRATDATLTTGAEVTSLAVTNYHLKLLELAAANLSQGTDDWRDISTLGFPATRSQFEYIKRRVAEFRREILKYLEDTAQAAADEGQAKLFHLNMQFFRAMKINWKKRSEQK